jgi:hypothetical protein
MHRTKFGLTMAAAALIATVGIAEPASAHAQASTARPAGDLYVVTPTQLAQIRAARAHGVADPEAALGLRAVSPKTVVGGGSSPWYSINATYHDADNRTVPYRTGFSDSQTGGHGGGFMHACMDHNLCTEYPVQVAVDGQPPTGMSGSYYQYEAYVVDNSDDSIVADIVVYQSPSRVGPDGDGTPDGLPFGVVTAYCIGYTDCPEWVNSL